MAEQEQLVPFQEEESKGMSLKEILAAAKEYWLEIRRNRRLIAYITAGITALMLVLAYTSKPTYTATLTFMVDDGSDGSSSATTLLSAFGLGKPATQNLDKIVALSKSRKIITDALFTKDTINGQVDFYANHFIREYNFQKEKWADKPALKNFFFTSGDETKFDRNANAALLTIYNMLIGGKEPGIFTPSYVNASGILSLQIVCTNEALAQGFIKVLFQNLSEYYILSNIEKEQATYDLVKMQTDSLRRVVRSKAYGAARFTDQNTGLLFSYNQMPGTEMAQEGQFAAEVYAKTLANLALADYALKDNRPYVMPLDYPIVPLPSTRSSLVLNLVIGLVLGGILGAGFVAGRKKYREFIATALA